MRVNAWIWLFVGCIQFYGASSSDMFDEWKEEIAEIFGWDEEKPVERYTRAASSDGYVKGQEPGEKPKWTADELEAERKQFALLEASSEVNRPPLLRPLEPLIYNHTDPGATVIYGFFKITPSLHLKDGDIKKPAYNAEISYKIVLTRRIPPHSALLLHCSKDLHIDEAKFIVYDEKTWKKEWTIAEEKFPTDDMKYEDARIELRPNQSQIALAFGRMIPPTVLVVKFKVSQTLNDDRVDRRRAGLVNVRTENGDLIYTMPGPISGRHVFPGIEALEQPTRWSGACEVDEDKRCLWNYGIYSMNGGTKYAYLKSSIAPMPLGLMTLIVSGYPQTRLSHKMKNGGTMTTHLLSPAGAQPADDKSEPPIAAVIKSLGEALWEYYDLDDATTTRKTGCVKNADKEYCMRMDGALIVAPNKLAVDTASPWVSVVRERYTMCATGHCSYTRYMQMWEAVAQNHLRALMLGNYIPGSWNHYWVPNGMAMHMLYVTLANKHQPFAHLKLRFSNVMRAAFTAGATARIGLASRDLESLTIDELEEMTTARGTVFRATAVFDTLMLGFRNADGEQTWMKEALRRFADDANPVDDKLWTGGQTSSYKFPPGVASLLTIVRPWVLEPSFPVVRVDCETDEHFCTLTQRPASRRTFSRNAMWAIPIEYWAPDGTSPTATIQFDWIPPGYKEWPMVVKQTSGVPIILKWEGRGYYRVEYSREEWKILFSYLIERLRSSSDWNAVTPLTRLALYADALDEGLVGEAWIEYPAQHPNHWRLYDSVLNEERPEVQPLLVQMLLDWNAKRNDPEPFERLMVNWLMQYGRLDEAYKAITEELKQPENIPEISTGLPQKAEYPLFLIRLSCYFDQRRCIDWAKAMFDADVKKHCQKQQKFSECTKLRPFIRPFVYCVVVTAGSQEDVDMITWARENEVDRTEQQNLIDAFRRECIKPKTPENDPYFRKRTGIRGIFAPFSIEKDDVYE